MVSSGSESDWRTGGPAAGGKLGMGVIAGDFAPAPTTILSARPPGRPAGRFTGFMKRLGRTATAIISTMARTTRRSIMGE